MGTVKIAGVPCKWTKVGGERLFKKNYILVGGGLNNYKINSQSTPLSTTCSSVLISLSRVSERT